MLGCFSFATPLNDYQDTSGMLREQMSKKKQLERGSVDI